MQTFTYHLVDLKSHPVETVPKKSPWVAIGGGTLVK